MNRSGLKKLMRDMLKLIALRNRYKAIQDKTLAALVEYESLSTGDVDILKGVFVELEGASTTWNNILAKLEEFNA